jgi:hypothetical protein
MYSGETGIIQGITQSCYRGFGIPSSLVYGSNASSNEFTIDSIFPDIINQNIEELKSPSGLIVTLDTTTLQQNYLVGNQQNDKDSQDEFEEE